MVRATYGAAAVYSLEAADRLFLALVRPDPTASVTLRPPGHMEGGIIDVSMPDLIRPLHYRGVARDAWDIRIEAEGEIAILFLH